MAIPFEQINAKGEVRKITFSQENPDWWTNPRLWGNHIRNKSYADNFERSIESRVIGNLFKKAMRVWDRELKQSNISRDDFLTVFYIMCEAIKQGRNIRRAISTELNIDLGIVDAYINLLHLDFMMRELDEDDLRLIFD